MSLPPPPPSPSAPALADHDALPPGTRFGELEIIRVLGVGGFGIVYLACDHSLERHVALKEYMPASLAARGVGPLITVRSGSFAETYAIGLRSFVNEARLLARFDHPSLVKVYRFWEDNATAYMVMPYLQGRTLRDVRRAMSQSPSEAWIRNLLSALLSALELLHREGVYHRDIAPDNILLPPEGPPILLDFGAARRVISDRTQSLTAILKPNYAPIEQYAEMTQLRQGPWTDLYALGAVAHFLLFGKPPSPATARAVHDDLAGLPQRMVEGISPRLMATVAWMLAVRPQQRPQNVEELRAVLDGRAPVPVLEQPPPTPASDLTLPLPGRTEFPPTLKIDSLSAMAAPAVAGFGADDTVIRPAAARSAALMAEAQRSASPMPAPAPSRRRGWMLALGLAGVCAAALAVWQFARPHDAPVAARATTVAPPVPTAVTSAPLVEPIIASEPASAAPVLVPESPAQPVAEPAATQDATAAVVLPVASAPRHPRLVARMTAQPAVRSAAVAAAQAPVETPPGAATPEPARVAAAASAAEPEGGPASAREACGKRVFLALWNCMDRECERPRYRDQPECVKVLDVKRRRGQ